MAAAVALDTPDLDQARELIGGLIAPFGLTPCRAAGYRARIRAGRIGALGVAEVSYRGAVAIESHAPADSVILEIPTQGYLRSAGRGTPGLAGGRRVEAGEAVASPPEQAIRTWMSDECRILILRVPEFAIGARRAAGATGGPSRPSGAAMPAPFLTPARLGAIERLARLAFEETAMSGPLDRDPDLGAELQHVMMALVGLSAGQPRTSDAAGVSPLPRSVRRAQALMMAAPGGGLPLSALASRCGVSVRTLQENFRHFAGTTPTDWWRGYRLDRVRDMLSAARPGVTVTDAALAFGFVHLGRFAAQYAARFGESPRETLRRAIRQREG